MEGFTRIEVVALTGINYDRLNYLTRKNLVVAKKIGTGHRGLFLYTWNQMILLLHIRDCKEILSKNKHIQLLASIFEDNDELFYSGVICRADFLQSGKILSLFSSMPENNFDFTKYIQFLNEGDDNTGAIYKVSPDNTDEIIKGEKASNLRQISFCRPISEYVKEMIENAKKSPDIDFEDFVKRANLTNLVEELELKKLTYN